MLLHSVCACLIGSIIQRKLPLPQVRSLIQAFSVPRNWHSIYRRGNDSIAVLDGLRGFSILWVALFHICIFTTVVFDANTAYSVLESTPLFFRWIWNGDKSLDIFFMISGFLISGLLFKEYQQTGKLDLKSFYLRRFLRLTPVYWFIIILYFIAKGDNYESLWANVLYINNFFPSEKMALNWTWSLALEEQFYIIFPLFLLTIFFASQKKITWLVGLFILSFFVRFYFYYTTEELWQANLSDVFNLNRTELFNLHFDVLYVNLYTRFGPFIAGILGAHLYFNHREQLDLFFQSTLSKWLCVLSVLTILILTGLPTYHDMDFPFWYQFIYGIFGHNLFAMATTLLLLASLFPHFFIGRWVNRFFGSKIWIPFAQLSYSTYIIHIFIVILVLYNLKANLIFYNIDVVNLHFYWLLIAIPFTILVTGFIATLLYLFIEKPFMNLRKGFRPQLAGKTQTSSEQEASSSRMTPLSKIAPVKPN